MPGLTRRPRKSPWRFRPGLWCCDCLGAGLLGLHFVGLQALLALHDLERDLLAFLQRLEAAALDRAEMDEQVLAAFRGDEAEALGVVEPLDGTGLTIGHDVLLLGTVFEVYTVRLGGSATVSARGNAKRWSGSADLPHRNHDVP